MPADTAARTGTARQRRSQPPLRSSDALPDQRRGRPPQRSPHRLRAARPTDQRRDADLRHLRLGRAVRPRGGHPLPERGVRRDRRRCPRQAGRLRLVPPLDPSGNSGAGREALHLLAERQRMSILWTAWSPGLRRCQGHQSTSAVRSRSNSGATVRMYVAVTWPLSRYTQMLPMRAGHTVSPQK